MVVLTFKPRTWEAEAGGYKCYSAEEKGVLVVGSQVTQEIYWERDKEVAASAWGRSSKDLRRRKALYRVSFGEQNFPGGLELLGLFGLILGLFPPVGQNLASNNWRGQK